MSLLPWWKVKRETRRLNRQFLARLDGVLGIGRRIRYDLAWPGHLRVTQGAAAPGPLMAIFLIYQPGGMAGSVYSAIDALRAGGASLIIVSNLPLSDNDRTTLAALSWRVVERPNLGYDFGGYREGLRQIQAAQLDPAELWILNDSGWFPCCPAPDGHSAPFAHQIDPDAAMSGAMFRHLKRAHQHKWIESYFLRFPRSTLVHPAFLRFFRRYPLLSLKYAVVRHGEMGLGRALGGAGLSIHSQMSNARFINLLAGQSTLFLRKTLNYGGLVPPALTTARAALLAADDSGPAWRAAVMDHVAASLDRSEFYYQFPYAAVHLMGFPFIKKGPDPRYMVWRMQHLTAVLAGDLPPLPAAIQAELFAAVARDKLKGDVDWRLPAG